MDSHSRSADIRAELQAMLDAVRDRHPSMPDIPDWPKARDEIVDKVLADSRPETRMADLEFGAEVLLFQTEAHVFTAWLDKSARCDDLAEGEGKDEGESSRMNRFREALDHLRQWWFLFVDSSLHRSFPSAYRRQVKADTAERIIKLCSSDKIEDRAKCARLSQYVWQSAADLPTVERRALVNFARTSKATPKRTNSPQEFFALVSAAFTVGKHLDDAFDAEVRRDRDEDDDASNWALSESERVRRALAAGSPER